MRHTFDFIIDNAPRRVEIATNLRNYLLHDTFLLDKQSSKQMLNLNLIMVALSGYLGCITDRLPGFLCKVLNVHGLSSLLFAWYAQRSTPTIGLPSVLSPS